MAPDIAGEGAAAETVRKFVGSAEGRKIFTRPPAGTELWRERSFDVFIDGTLHSGTFDRVQIERSGGRAVSARVYDFKTDRESGDLQERYREQMEIYRRATAALLGLDLSAVSAEPVAV